MKTIFNLANHVIQMPSGAYLTRAGTPKSRGILQDSEIPENHVLWRYMRVSPPKALIVDGEVVTLEEAVAMVPGFIVPVSDNVIPPQKPNAVVTSRPPTTAQVQEYLETQRQEASELPTTAEVQEEQPPGAPPAIEAPASAPSAPVAETPASSDPAPASAAPASAMSEVDEITKGLGGGNKPKPPQGRPEAKKGR